jgi:hypothetical protein
MALHRELFEAQNVEPSILFVATDACLEQPVQISTAILKS